jgi:hypothetical protein
MTIALRCLLISAMAILVATQIAVAGDVYKTVDAQGHVIYSDRALSPNSTKMTLDIIQGNPQDAARLAKTMAAANADAAQQAKLATQQAADQQRQQAQQEQQRRRCEIARGRYATFAAGGRLFHADEQGNRVYYSDAEIDAQRASAQAEMDAACLQ